jgi:putative protease
VATVVHAYRQVLDGAKPEDVEEDLYAISHRPYGTGFYYGEPDQTPELDGYVKECLHVATVQACEPCEQDASQWLLTVVCHNRFEEGQAIELVTPARPVDHFAVSELRWLPHAHEGVEWVTPEPVAVANRAMEHYAFVSPVPCEPGDFLRVRVNKKVNA